MEMLVNATTYDFASSYKALIQASCYLNLRLVHEHGVQEKLLQAAQNPAMYFHDQ